MKLWQKNTEVNELMLINNKQCALLIAVAATMFLTGCGESEKTYTITDFVNDHALMEKVDAACRENPGDIGNTPNCINVEAALRKVKYEGLAKKYSQ